MYMSIIPSNQRIKIDKIIVQEICLYIVKSNLCSASILFPPRISHIAPTLGKNYALFFCHSLGYDQFLDIHWFPSLEVVTVRFLFQELDFARAWRRECCVSVAVSHLTFIFTSLLCFCWKLSSSSSSLNPHRRHHCHHHYHCLRCLYQYYHHFE